MIRRFLVGLVSAFALAVPATVAAAGPDTDSGNPRAPETAAAAPADELLAALENAERELLTDLLERNPEIARARHEAAAAMVRAPQVRSLPDPTAQLSYFVLSPETRVGPQRVSVGLSQRLPWLGSLDRLEQASVLAAAAASARLEATRLKTLTSARVRLAELAFLDQEAEIEREELQHLARHEEVARARYAAGVGLQQDVLRIQAGITREEGRLLEIEMRRRTVEAAWAALRGEAMAPPIALPALPTPVEIPVAAEKLAEWGRNRPELVAADAEVARQQALVEHADLEGRPEFMVGLGYTVVDRREDAAGIANPPEGNGDDIFAVTGGISLPIWRGRVEARFEEASHRLRAAEESRRGVEAAIASEVGDLTARLPLLAREHALYQGVLLVQAEEALRSAEAAYATGAGDALRLLDAEHVLFEVRLAAARVRSDWAAAIARLEGAIGRSLHELTEVSS